MTDRREDIQVAQLITQAAPPPRPELRDRALEAMAKVGPRRRASRLRVVALATAAVALLLGLGFLPFPAGSAKGAWDRAVAAAEKTRGLHVTGRMFTAAGEFSFEQWRSGDGFSRFDLRHQGRLLAMSLYDRGGRQVIPDSNTLQAVQGLGGAPPSGVGIGLLGPELHFAFDRGNVLPPIWDTPEAQWPGGRKQVVARLFHLKDLFALRVTEKRERTLWGGLREVVAAEGRARQAISLGNVTFLPLVLWQGDRIRVRAETDPASGKLSSLAVLKLVNGAWRPIYVTDSIAWDAEVPKEVRAVEPPPGHVELVDPWWGKRLASVLRAGATRSWEVTLHALDVNRHGDVFITFSRKQKPAARERSNGWSLPMLAGAARAVDDCGVSYAPSTRGHQFDTPRVVKGYADPVFFAQPDVHVRMRLSRGKPSTPGAAPTEVSVTISSGAPRGMATEAITFRHIPLPPSQAGDDLIAEGQQKRQF